jgi:hypothetical protein
MKKIIKLTESDLTRLVRRVIKENENPLGDISLDILDRLTPKEKSVLMLFYGLGGESPMSLDEIGARFDLTRERIKQIKEKALRRIEFIKNKMSKSEEELNTIEKKKKEFKSEIGKIIRQYSLDLSADEINDIILDIRMNTPNLR